jgi:glycosyltransferase involved in cell wall biosynthesis
MSSSLNQAKEIRVTFFPSPFQNDAWGKKGNPHLLELNRELSRAGLITAGLDKLPSARPSSRFFEVLYLHWTEAISNELISRNVLTYRILYHLGAARALRKLVRKHCSALFCNFDALVFHLHEFSSHDAIAGSLFATVDDEVKRAAVQHASGIAVAELGISSVLPVDLQKPAEVWAPLGDYSTFHGAPLLKQEARKRLFETSVAGTVFAYVGTARNNRNASDTVDAFQKLRRIYPDARLVIAGMNHFSFIANSVAGLEGVTLLDGLLERETIRDVICAADFIVQDGAQYLTSAVVRTAISYSCPVIAYDFGCTSSMARGCLIPIESNLLSSMLRAVEIDLAEVSEMQTQARLRNAERSWIVAGQNLSGFFRQLPITEKSK